jgi:hypothetical protein
LDGEAVAEAVGASQPEIPGNEAFDAPEDRDRLPCLGGVGQPRRPGALARAELDRRTGETAGARLRTGRGWALSAAGGEREAGQRREDDKRPGEEEDGSAFQVGHALDG